MCACTRIVKKVEPVVREIHTSFKSAASALSINELVKRASIHITTSPIPSDPTNANADAHADANADSTTTTATSPSPATTSPNASPPSANPIATAVSPTATASQLDAITQTAPSAPPTQSEGRPLSSIGRVTTPTGPPSSMPSARPMPSVPPAKPPRAQRPPGPTTQSAKVRPLVPIMNASSLVPKRPAPSPPIGATQSRPPQHMAMSTDDSNATTKQEAAPAMAMSLDSASTATTATPPNSLRARPPIAGRAAAATVLATRAPSASTTSATAAPRAPGSPSLMSSSSSPSSSTLRANTRELPPWFSKPSTALHVSRDAEAASDKHSSPKRAPLMRSTSALSLGSRTVQGTMMLPPRRPAPQLPDGIASSPTASPASSPTTVDGRRNLVKLVSPPVHHSSSDLHATPRRIAPPKYQVIVNSTDGSRPMRRLPRAAAPVPTPPSVAQSNGE